MDAPAVAGQRSVVFFRSNLAAENNIWNEYLTSLLEGQTATGITISEDYNLFFNAPLGATVPPGAHSLTADPQFVDPSAADFSLSSSSPAIDSGDNSALPAGILTDLADQPRFVEIRRRSEHRRGHAAGGSRRFRILAGGGVPAINSEMSRVAITSLWAFAIVK